MKKNSLIYVAGHTGFIGKAVVKKLKEKGYRNLILKTRRQLDLTSQKRVENFFKKYHPEYVFLFAAKVGGIFANSKYPADFIYQNLMIQTNVIHFAYKYKVKKLLFLGSSCMYPKFCPQPIKEEYLLTGKIESTNEGFGIAKICGIKMCIAYNKQYKTNFITAVPATVYGPRDHFGKEGHVVAALIEKFFKAVKYSKKEVKIWGTGRPKREFIYVDDTAEACIFLMNNYKGNEIIHIGTGKSISIRELAQKLKEISGFKGKIVYDRSRPDGIPQRLLDSEKIFKMGFNPKVDLDMGLKITYIWYKNHKK